MAKVMMEACVCHIDAWMTANKLKMNRDKTELLVLNGHHRPLPPLTTISVRDEEINTSTKATMGDKSVETLGSKILFSSILDTFPPSPPNDADFFL